MLPIVIPAKVFGFYSGGLIEFVQDPVFVQCCIHITAETADGKASLRFGIVRMRDDREIESKNPGQRYGISG
jgi:hypothetical protein